MAKYVSGRQKNLKVGIASYSEDLTSLEVIGGATFTGESSGELVRISQIGTGPAFVVEDSANPDTTPFAVTTDGRVAIGVAVGGISSSYKLEVDGNGNGGGVRFVSGGQGDLIFSHSNLVSNVRAAGDVQLGLGANGGDAIRINLDNNVGLGSTNPTSKLYVVGDGYFTGVVTSSNFYVGNSLIGGGSSFTQLYVSGISTLGVTSATNLTSQQLNVSGITTLGVVTSGNIYSTGVITATTFSGNASSATYATSAGIATYATSAGIATYATSSGIATYASNAGIATYATTAGIATYATNAGIATALQNSRTFEITGDIVASPISFNGTGNVSLAATIQPNSVALGGDTTGDYVQSITGTSNQIVVSVTSGEGSTPTLSIPNQFTAPQDVTVTRDLQVNRNLNVNGNITIGGTSATIFSQSLTISDPDIVLGFRTDAFGNDVSTDNTANHGGVALASTEGSPLVQLFIAGIETNPATYKKIMWFKAGTFAGLGTDAWLSNYAVGIGSTQFPTGTRLAAGSVQFTQNDLAVVRNINASGIVTAPTLSGTTVTYTTGNFTTGNIVTGIVTTLSGTNLNYTGVGTITTLNSTTGTVTNLSGTNLNYTGISTLGVTSATNLTAQQLNISGVSTFQSDIFFGDNDIAYFGNGNDLLIYHSGLNSYVRESGTGRLLLASDGPSVDIVKGTDTETLAKFNIDGSVELYYDNTKEFETTGYGATVFGILQSQGLQVSGASTFSGITTHTTPLFGTQASFTGVVTASSFSGNASSATYATTAGVSTSVSGGTASVTQLNVSLSGITTVGFITATDIWNAGITTSSRLTLNGANSTTTGGGQIYLNGASGNRIDFNTNGAAAPTFTTRSAGTKIVLYPSVGASKVDYAFGINTNVLWYSVEDSGSQFKWYAGTTQLADLKGSGELVIGSSTLTGTASQLLQVTGGGYFNGSVGIGVTNPEKLLHLSTSVATPLIIQRTNTNNSAAEYRNASGSMWAGLGGSANGWGVASSADVGVDAHILVTRTSGELLVGSTTLTGTASQKLQVNSGGYFNGLVGIGTTNPSSTLDVRSSSATIRVQDTTNNYSVALNPTTGPRVSFGIGGNDSFMEFGAYASINNLDTKARDLRIFSSAAPNAFTLQQSTGNIGINSTTPTSKLDVVGDVKVIGVVTATSFSGNASSATYATNAGIATNLKGGSGGTIVYQSATDTTAFLANGTAGYILQSNGGTSAPTWVPAAPSSAFTGLTIRDEGTIVGSANSVSQLNFVGAIVSAASTAGIATITFLDYVSNAGVATYATNAGISTNLKGGLVGNIPYQSAADTTTFLTNGSSGTILQSNGVGNAPTWVTPAPAGAITGLTVRDEGTVVGGANSVSTLNFVGAIVSAASTAGIATITFLDYVSNAGTSTSVSGGTASVTQLNVSGITTTNNLNVTGVGTFLSSGLKIRNPANTFQYNITGGAIAADRILNLPVITATDTVATLGLTQTFTGTNNTFTNTLTANGTLDLTGSATGTHVFGTNQTTGTLTFGGTSGTGLITFGRATTSQQTDIQAGASGVGTTKTINFGTGGLSGSLTQINIGPTAGVGTVTINSGTNLGINSTRPTSKLDVVGDVKVIGVVTATSFSGNASSATYATAAGIATYATTAGIATYASTAGVATALQNSRTFEITGDIIASPISFNGTGNVSLAATIQPNSVALGSDTTGDYVQTVTGTSNQITVTGGTGEGSTPTLSIPNQFTAPQDVTVTRDLQVNRNLNVNGNITIGGTSATIFSQSLNIFDPDIVLGYRTDGSGNDASNDNTANHGGVAIASTEGSPLVQLFIAGIETNPATYKKIMWFKAGTFTGLGTDAWLSNYAVGIGSTQFPTGTRLAAGSVQFTENDLAVVRNINASGIVTALSFSGNASSATYATSSGIATYSTSAGIATYATSSGIATYSTSAGIATYATSAGIATYATSAGIATYATSSGIATYSTSAGIATYATSAGIATYATSAGIATYATSAGIATYATSAGISTSVIGGIGSITQLQVTGVSTFTNGPVFIGAATSTGTAAQRLQVTGGAYVSGSVGIGTTNPQYELDVNGAIHTTNDIDLDSTTGVLNLRGRPNLAVGGNNPIVTISHPIGGSLYSLYGWQDIGNDRVYQQLANSTDYFTALSSDSEFIIGLSGGLLDGSAYSFKIDIDAETSLYFNNSEKLTTTNQGILVTGLTSTTTLNVGTGGTVITTTATGSVGIGTTNPIGTLEVVGSVVADGSDIRNLPRTQLVSYASASDISNSALSITGVSTYTLVGSFSTTYEYSYSGPAISADGGTIIVGDWSASSLGVEGAVYVYDRVGAGSSIVQVGILTNGISVGGGNVAAFGYSVATSADGKTIAVGALGDELSGTANYGLVYVFDRVGVGSLSTFNRVGILTGSFATVGYEFGERVVVSGNGKTIVVGAPTDERSGTTGNGLVYVFDRIGNSFRQVDVLNGSLALNVGDRFGDSVATSYDGKTIIVGASVDEQSGSGSGSGVAYVFDRVGLGTSFNQVGILTGFYASNADDSFGISVATSVDGKTIIVGAPGDEIGATAGAGVVYVFDRVGNSFNQVGILTGSRSSFLSRFGYSVATSADGKTIASYAPLNSPNGLVYIHKRQGNSFTEVGIVTYSTLNDTYSEERIALTADGKTLILSNQQGIYVYDQVQNTYLYSGQTGNIGIGTSNPTSKLHVQGNTYLDGTLDITGDISSVGNINVSDTKTLSFIGGASVISNPQITIAAVNSSANLYELLAYDVTSGTDYVLELIKTATDRQFLLGNNREFVVAYDPLSYPAADYNYAFKVKIGAETSLYYNQTEKLTTTNQGILVTGLTSTTTLNVGTGGTVITTTATGLVGIGTTNPLGTLQVGTGITMYGATGIISATSYRGDGSQLSGISAGLTVADDTSTNATRYILFDDVTSGTISAINVSSTKLTFNPSTGNMVVGGTVTANSDEKLKTNIKTIDNALDKVLSLRGVEYDRIDTGDHQIGVIAQEVEKIIPDVVYPKQPAPDYETKSVAYANLVGLLIEAIKEQNVRIEELERKLEEK